MRFAPPSARVLGPRGARRAPGDARSKQLALTPAGEAARRIGIRRLHPEQERGIAAALDGRNVLMVLPTGFGKSACYQIPSMLLPKPVVVVSPLLALLKAKPESVTLGTYGGINMAAMVGQFTKARLGAAFFPIPYKSASQALNAALAGDVQVVGFALGAAATHVKSGKMKPYAVNSDKRLPGFPNVPTLKETGIDVNYRSWFAFFAPAAVPREMVRRLNTEVAKMIADPQFAQRLLELGSEPQSSTPAGLLAHMRAESERWSKVIKDAGIRAE